METLFDRAAKINADAGHEDAVGARPARPCVRRVRRDDSRLARHQRLRAHDRLRRLHARDGHRRVRHSFTAQEREERGWLILRGLLGITVGVLVFAWPGISALALLYVIGGVRRRARDPLRRRVVPAPAGRPRQGVDGSDGRRRDRLRDRDLREARRRCARGARTDRGVRARHRDQRARCRDRAARSCSSGMCKTFASRRQSLKTPEPSH